MSAATTDEAPSSMPWGSKRNDDAVVVQSGNGDNGHSGRAAGPSSSRRGVGRGRRQRGASDNGDNCSSNHRRSLSAGSSHRRGRRSTKSSLNSEEITGSHHDSRASMTSRSNSPHHLQQRREARKVKHHSALQKKNCEDGGESRSNSPHYLPTKSNHKKKECGSTDTSSRRGSRTRHHRRCSTADAITIPSEEAQPDKVSAGGSEVPSHPISSPQSPTQRSKRSSRSHRTTLSSEGLTLATEPTSITRSPTTSIRHRKLKLPELDLITSQKCQHAPRPKSPTSSSRSSTSSSMSHSQQTLTTIEPESEQQQHEENELVMIDSGNPSNGHGGDPKNETSREFLTKSPAPRIVLTTAPTPMTCPSPARRSNSGLGGNGRDGAIISIREFIANLPLATDDGDKSKHETKHQTTDDTGGSEIFHISSCKPTTMVLDNNSNKSFGSINSKNIRRDKKKKKSLSMPIGSTSGYNNHRTKCKEERDRRSHGRDKNTSRTKPSNSITELSSSLASLPIPSSSFNLVTPSQAAISSFNQSAPCILPDDISRSSSQEDSRNHRRDSSIRSVKREERKKDSRLSDPANGTILNSLMMDGEPLNEEFHNSWPSTTAQQLNSLFLSQNVEDGVDCVSVFSEPFPEHSPKTGIRKTPLEISHTNHASGGVVASILPLNDLDGTICDISSSELSVPAWMTRRNHPQPYTDFYASHDNILSGNSAVPTNKSNDDGGAIGKISPSTDQTCRPNISMTAMEITDLPSIMNSVEAGSGRRRRDDHHHPSPSQENNRGGLQRKSRPFRSDDLKKIKLKRPSPATLGSFLSLTKASAMNKKDNRKGLNVRIGETNEGRALVDDPNYEDCEDSIWCDNVTLASTVNMSLSDAPLLAHHRSSSPASSVRNSSEQQRQTQKQELHGKKRGQAEPTTSSKLSSTHTSSTVTTGSSL